MNVWPLFISQPAPSCPLVSSRPLSRRSWLPPLPPDLPQKVTWPHVIPYLHNDGHQNKGCCGKGSEEDWSPDLGGQLINGSLTFVQYLIKWHWGKSQLNGRKLFPGHQTMVKSGCRLSRMFPVIRFCIQWNINFILTCLSSCPWGSCSSLYLLRGRGILERWNHGTLEPWDPGTMESWFLEL